MKLYFSPGACSLSPHIALCESGLPFEIQKVDLKSKKYGKDQDFTKINPKGYVPALQFEDGSVLTEGPVIAQWIADQTPEKHLAPPAGTMERYRLMEWQIFVSTELHKQFSPLFNPASDEAVKQRQRDLLARRFDYLQGALGDRPYLMGDSFTVADCYLFTVLRWTQPMGIDLAKWPRLAAYVERVNARPKVRAAIEAEKNAPQ
jgi:glutathione S-transferase